MSPPKPSPELLRDLTDENVLRALMAHGRLTRAEIATVAGASEPTVSDRVQRPERAGPVVYTGERTTGRGRAGSAYPLAPRRGTAPVAGIAPYGVTAAAVDVLGSTGGQVRAAREADAGREAAAGTLAARAARPGDRTDAPMRLPAPCCRPSAPRRTRGPSSSAGRGAPAPA
ncbi:winged helix-turn-helix transcriptional regulator [Streptomyces glaucus]